MAETTQFVVALLQEVDGELIGEEAFKRYTLLCQELLSEKESYIDFLAEAAQRKPLGVITLGHSAALYAGGRHSSFYTEVCLGGEKSKQAH